MSGPIEGKYICYAPLNKYDSKKEECLAHITDANLKAKIKAVDRVCCTYTQLVNVVSDSSFATYKPLL